MGIDAEHDFVTPRHLVMDYLTETVEEVKADSSNEVEVAVPKRKRMSPPMDPIFSRIHSPPPRHQIQTQTQRVERVQTESVQTEMAIENERHYYNARYPPRRGRFGQNEMMVNGNGSAGHLNAYAPRTNVFGRYAHSPTRGGGGSGAGGEVKMEWKKKSRSEVGF